MTSILSIITGFVSRLLKSSAAKITGSVIGGIILTLLFFMLWKSCASLGSRAIYMVIGGILVAALILLIIYLLWKNIQLSRSKKMEAALGETAQQKKQRQQQLKTAIGSIKDKWQTAMATLKARKINIYDSPWVLLIGEPQSGKTTTLKQSGLDFPIGKDALSGAGGTVNCDWWFTNDAVIIDTAGRFTLPVDSAPDKEEWQAFLKLLAKHRPQCPINNVIVTIPVTSFLDDDANRQKEKAGKIRDKLLEITEVLGVEFPIYIMVSKSDLINGFTEFCASLASIENTQILGWNQDTDPRPFNPESFHHRFETLRHRFYKWSLRRLRDLSVGNEADRIFSFHTGFSHIKKPLESYLSTIFKEDKFHPTLLFRGCFFSSGLQEGQAIVKALESEEGSGAAQFSESFAKSRPYFIYNFYRKVFLENGLVTRMGNVSQKERKLKTCAMIIACLFSVISVWYLWTGYSLLTKVLKPTHARVEQAGDLAGTDKGPTARHPASDVVTLAEAIKKDRNRLASKGISYRFLRGKDNSIIKDMKNIEDAVLLKGLFQPIMGDAAQKIIIPPTRYEDRIRLIDNLSLGLGVLLKSPRQLYSLEPDVAMVKNQAPWMDVETETVLSLADGFPTGETLDLSHADPEKSRWFIRQEITGLYRFWKTFPEKNWLMLKQDLLDAMKQYRAMLNSKDITIEEERAFKHNAGKFVSAANRLLEYSSGTRAVFPAKLHQECEKDYQLLAGLLDQGKAQKEIEFFQPTVERHLGVCRETNKAILSDLGRHPDLLNSLLTKDGDIHPEFESVLGIVDLVLKFTPLFGEPHQKMIIQNPERIIGFLEAWDTKWHTKKMELEELLSEKIQSLNAPGWKKDQLKTVIGNYLNDEIWDADLKAALTAISTILEGNTLTETVLTRGMNLPNAARIKWLEEKFTLFSDINSWLVKKYPSRPDITQGTGKITQSMTRIYKDYLFFWNNTLEGYDPSLSIVSARTWGQYRKQVLNKRGLFLDPGSWPFNLFLENVTSTGLDNLKKILGEDRDDSVIALEKNVTRTAFVYSMASGNLGALGSAQDRFYQCVDSLSEMPSQALSSLDDDNDMMYSFRSFSSFRNRVDSGLGGGEILAARLEKIQKHGLGILKKGYAAGFSQGKKQLIGKWYDRFKGNYPFARVNEIKSWSGRNENTVSVHHTTASSADFYDFCFDQSLGLDALDKKYGLRQAIEKDTTGKRYRFSRPGIQWMDFVYGQNQSARVHDIKITISDEDSQISKKYTVLQIRGLHKDRGGKTLKLRFSGSRYKTAKGVWHIDQDIPVQFLVENEETRESAQVILLESDFSFPAYLVRNGKKTRISNSREWELPLAFFSKNSDTEPQKVNLIIEWDEPLPAFIPLGK
jgi:hypothetical protein